MEILALALIAGGIGYWWFNRSINKSEQRKMEEQAPYKVEQPHITLPPPPLGMLPVAPPIVKEEPAPIVVAPAETPVWNGFPKSPDAPVEKVEEKPAKVSKARTKKVAPLDQPAPQRKPRKKKA